MAWMAWTWPTALFFVSIAAALLLLTVLELRFPTRARRGLLPLVTTRGDRFFMALLLAAFVHVLWLKFFDASVLWASLLALGGAGALLRWG
jgi:predicted small integral membrane protein